jgi:hypothetical protein
VTASKSTKKRWRLFARLASRFLASATKKSKKLSAYAIAGNFLGILRRLPSAFCYCQIGVLSVDGFAHPVAACVPVQSHRFPLFLEGPPP